MVRDFRRYAGYKLLAVWVHGNHGRSFLLQVS
jgi:hypothetical protein